jgi:hypothetical protein
VIVAPQRTPHDLVDKERVNPIMNVNKEVGLELFVKFIPMHEVKLDLRYFEFNFVISDV